MSLPPIPQVGPSLVPRNDHLEIAPYAPGEAEEKPVVRVVEMTPTITHGAKLLAHSPEPGVRALADKKMPGAIAQHLGNAGGGAQPPLTLLDVRALGSASQAVC